MNVQNRVGTSASRLQLSADVLGEVVVFREVFDLKWPEECVLYLVCVVAW
jgi:hypothetical protein